MMLSLMSSQYQNLIQMQILIAHALDLPQKLKLLTGAQAATWTSDQSQKCLCSSSGILHWMRCGALTTTAPICPRSMCQRSFQPLPRSLLRPQPDPAYLQDQLCLPKQSGAADTSHEVHSSDNCLSDAIAGWLCKCALQECPKCCLCLCAASAPVLAPGVFAQAPTPELGPRPLYIAAPAQ